VTSAPARRTKVKQDLTDGSEAMRSHLSSSILYACRLSSRLSTSNNPGGRLTRVGGSTIFLEEVDGGGGSS
jgi:hypothetical protein